MFKSSWWFSSQEAGKGSLDQPNVLLPLVLGSSLGGRHSDTFFLLSQCSITKVFDKEQEFDGTKEQGTRIWEPGAIVKEPGAGGQ